MPAFVPMFVFLGAILVPVVSLSWLVSRSMAGEQHPGRFRWICGGFLAFWIGLPSLMLVCAYNMRPWEFAFCFGTYSPLALIIEGFGLWLIGVTGSTALHEFGHFVPAKLFGYWVPIFSVGNDPSHLVLGTWFGTQFRLANLTWNGFILSPELSNVRTCTPEDEAEFLEKIKNETGQDPPPSRSFTLTQHIWVAAGGLCVTALIALAFGFGWLFSDGVASLACASMFIWNALLFAWNLLPREGSDGERLLDLLKKRTVGVENA